MATNETRKKTCPTCQGYGWWPIGRLCPIGRRDATEWGDLVVQCPWCGAGTKKGERYDALLKAKEV